MQTSDNIVESPHPVCVCVSVICSQGTDFIYCLNLKELKASSVNLCDPGALTIIPSPPPFGFISLFFLICRFPTSSRILQLILVIYIFKDIFHFAKILRFIHRGVCIVLPCTSLNLISGSAQVGHFLMPNFVGAPFCLFWGLLVEICRALSVFLIDSKMDFPGLQSFRFLFRFYEIKKNYI